MSKGEWQIVVFADELPKCELCEEPWCPVHHEHFADCDCFGPTQDGIEYEEREGVLWGRKNAED